MFLVFGFQHCDCTWSYMIVMLCASSFPSTSYGEFSWQQVTCMILPKFLFCVREMRRALRAILVLASGVSSCVFISVLFTWKTLCMRGLLRPKNHGQIWRTGTPNAFHRHRTLEMERNEHLSTRFSVVMIKAQRKLLQTEDECFRKSFGQNWG